MKKENAVYLLIAILVVSLFILVIFVITNYYICKYRRILSQISYLQPTER